MYTKQIVCGRHRAGLYRKQNINHVNLKKIACAHLVMSNTALAHNLPAGLMTYTGRGRKSVSSARHKAQYLCHVGFGMTLTMVGETFKRDRTSVAHACQQVEESRDTQNQDLALNCLETGLQELANSLQLVR